MIMKKLDLFLSDIKAMMVPYGVYFKDSSWKIEKRDNEKLVEFYLFTEDGKKYGGFVDHKIMKSGFFVDELKFEYVKIFKKIFEIKDDAHQ